MGFGAHHWRVSGADTILFVTFDQLGDRHTRESLEAAYAGAAGTRSTRPRLRPGSPADDDGGGYTVPFEDGALSVTPWRNGTISGDGTMSAARARATRGMLDRLHAAAPPPGIPRWRPLVGPDLADDLAARTASAWDSGPYGEDARAAIRDRLDDIAAWTATYHRLAATATDRRAALGPDPRRAAHPQPADHAGRRRPDRLGVAQAGAPRARPAHPRRRRPPAARTPTTAMLDLFDLEWRLDEIAQYAAWFEAWHTGTESDAIAFGGLHRRADA